MITIALITEGVTDRPILSAIIHAFAEQYLPEQPIVNILHPKEQEPGGWTRVFNYCASDEIRDAFKFNDYVVIQIDTDRHLDKGYDVPQCSTTIELIAAVKSKLIEKMGIDFYETNEKKILFAICIDAVECWLLPFYATTLKDQQKEKGCCGTVNKYLEKLNIKINGKKGYTLDCTNDAGGYKYYALASQGLYKKKDFFPKYKKSESLRQFVEIELAKIAAHT
jgi:hypothetical protein